MESVSVSGRFSPKPLYGTPAAFATRAGPPFEYSATAAGDETTTDFAPRLRIACVAPMFE